MKFAFKNPLTPQIKKSTTVFRAVTLSHDTQERVGFPNYQHFRSATFSIKRVKLGCSNQWWFGYKRVFTKIIFDISVEFVDINGRVYDFHWMSTAPTQSEAIDNCVMMFLHRYRMNRAAKKIVETTAV